RFQRRGSPPRRSQRFLHLMMTLVSSIENRHNMIPGRCYASGSNRSWRMYRFTPTTQGPRPYAIPLGVDRFEIWHYSTLMFAWLESPKVHKKVVECSICNRSRSDHGGMRAIFTTLELRRYYS